MALVIERQQLALEARKQTRASESLKMTSKSQLYVSHHFCSLSNGLSMDCPKGFFFNRETINKLISAAEFTICLQPDFPNQDVGAGRIV